MGGIDWLIKLAWEPGLALPSLPAGRARSTSRSDGVKKVQN